MTTPNWQAPDISESQAQKATTANTAHAHIEAACSEETALTVTTADVTLTDDQHNKSLRLKCSGAMTAARNVIVKARKHVFHVKHECSGGYAITVKTAAGSGVSLVNGQRRWLYCDGTNVVALQESAKRTFGYQVEDLAAGVDIGDGTAANARSFFVGPFAGRVTRALIVPQGTAAGIDDANTCVITIYKGAATVVAKTYNTGTPFPADHVLADLGTLANNAFTNADEFRVDVVNGATADPPAFMLLIEYEPAE